MPHGHAAACSDWRFSVRRFHVGTGHAEPASDAGCTTAGSSLTPRTSIRSLLLGGSPYTRGLALLACDKEVRGQTKYEKSKRCPIDADDCSEWLAVGADQSGEYEERRDADQAGDQRQAMKLRLEGGVGKESSE